MRKRKFFNCDFCPINEFDGEQHDELGNFAIPKNKQKMVLKVQLGRLLYYCSDFSVNKNINKTLNCTCPSVFLFLSFNYNSIIQKSFL